MTDPPLLSLEDRIEKVEQDLEAALRTTRFLIILARQQAASMAELVSLIEEATVTLPPDAFHASSLPIQ